MIISRYFPEIHQDTVELDPDVAECAKKYFNLREHDKLKVYIRDGRVQVRKFIRDGKKYDMIFMDVFRGGYIPYHMTTLEFMKDIQKLLAPGGCMAINLRSGFQSYHYQRRTIAKAFKNQYTYGSSGNVIVVADNNSRKYSFEELASSAAELAEQHDFSFNFPLFLKDMLEEAPYVTEGKILTDDYAPADVLRTIED